MLTVYDEHGGYGHPDHVAVHRVGVLAAQLAGTPAGAGGHRSTADLLKRGVRAMGVLHLGRGIEVPPMAGAYLRAARSRTASTCARSPAPSARRWRRTCRRPAVSRPTAARWGCCSGCRGRCSAHSSGTSGSRSAARSGPCARPARCSLTRRARHDRRDRCCYRRGGVPSAYPSLAARRDRRRGAARRRLRPGARRRFDPRRAWPWTTPTGCSTSNGGCTSTSSTSSTTGWPGTWTSSWPRPGTTR